MPRLLIVPEFSNVLEDNTHELCDFFHIRVESAVPVEQFSLLSDCQHSSFPVEPGKFKTALLLLYWAVTSRATRYFVSRPQQDQIALYFGESLVHKAQCAPQNHPALALLLGDSVTVELDLKPGYQLPDCRGRTIEELITWGWERRDELTAETPVPMIRQALATFQRALNSHAIPIVQCDDPNVWLSRCWVQRVYELLTRLNIPPQPAST